jgi:Uma2 family endonuclease
MVPPELIERGVYYPETDGKPMAETDLHRELIVDLIESARHRFRDDREVYVTGDLLVYFEEGNPEMVVAPDFFAVRGVHKEERRIYKLWFEGKAPEVVVEVTSRSTHLEDLGRKRTIYESMGVLEYFIFDPEGHRFQPQLQGFRLRGGALQPVGAERAPDGDLVFRSEVLGLDLRAGGRLIRWVDPATGEPIPGTHETYKLKDIEKARADAAEAKVARLQEEIARLRGEGR